VESGDAPWAAVLNATATNTNGHDDRREGESRPHLFAANNIFK
jgi:hypothetical protein